MIPLLLALAGCVVLGEPPVATTQGGGCDGVDVTARLYRSEASADVVDAVTIDGELEYTGDVDPGILAVHVLGVAATAAGGSLVQFSVSLTRDQLADRVNEGDDVVRIEAIEVIDACGVRSVPCGD